MCETSILTFTLETIFVSFFVFYILSFVWKRRRLYYYASKINGPLSLPLIGSTYLFFGGTKNILEKGMRMVSKYKPLVKFWLGTNLTFIITKPEDVEIVLNKCLDKEHNYKFLIPIFGNGLITVKPVHEWKRHRKMIGTTFNQQILNSFVNIFASYSNILVDKLEETLGKGCVDLFPVLTQCTLDIVCDTTMGTKVHAMTKKSQYILWTSRASELGIIRMFNIFLHPNFLWRLTPMSKEMDTVSEKLHHYIREIIETKKQYKSQMMDKKNDETIKKKAFLDYMIELTDNEDRLSDEELIEETRTLIVAGSDATALTVCYVLMMLGMHKEVQDAVHKELDTVFKTENISSENIQRLIYLDRVIKETLRIFPVGPIVARHIPNDLILGNHTLPQGSSVSIPIIYMHRDPDVWSDPLKFNPDRFLPEEVAKRHPYTYLPFSGGPRNCIGFRYAIMAVKTILSTILRHYEVVSTAYGSILEIQLKFDIATKCVGGQKVELTKRFGT